MNGQTEIQIDAELKALADQALNERIAQIVDFSKDNPDHKVAKMNAGLGESDERWHCAGALEIAGFAWWTLHVQMDFAYPQVRLFNASGGPSWALTAGIGAIAGSFVVPAEKLTPGTYNFSVSQLSFKVGGIGFDLFDRNHKLLGTCYGVIAGAGGASLSGSGELSW